MEQLVPAQDVIKPDSINNVATMPPQQNQDVDGSSEKWGMPLGDLYRLGMSFFKGKNETVLVQETIRRLFCIFFDHDPDRQNY